MDFALPDEGTMEVMRKEFEKIRCDSTAYAIAASLQCNRKTENGSCIEDDCRAENDNRNTLENSCARERYDKSCLPVGCVMLLVLFLYFARALSYNSTYGTEILNGDGSLGRLRPVERTFGTLNSLI